MPLIEAVRFGEHPAITSLFGLTMAIFSIAKRQGLAEYAQYALDDCRHSRRKLKLTQLARHTLLAHSQACLPKSNAVA